MSASSAAGWMNAGATASASTRTHEHRRTARFPVARLILFATICAAPLAFGAVQAWAWPVLVLLALVTFAAWGAACLRQGAVRVHWSPLYWLGALFLALGLVQYFGGLTQSRFATRNALFLLAGDLILFFVAGQLLAGESSNVYRQFGQVVALFTFGLSLFSIFQFFTSHGFIYWSIHPPRAAVFGPYVNRDDYAGLMEMLIPISAAYAFLRRPGDSHRVLYMFGVAIAVASLLLTGSRGGMVALLCEAVIFAALAFRLQSFARWRHSALVGILALAAGIGLSIWLNPGYLSTRMASVANFPIAPEVTLGQRLVVTRDTLAMFGAHPWLGAGLGSFMVAFPRYQSFAGNAIWQHAHDDYAEALAETGLVGGLLLLAGLIVFLRTAFGNVKERLESSSGWIQLGCALGCCGLLVHSFVDFNLHIPANAAWFAVCLGLATAPPILAHRSVRPKGQAEKE